MQELTFEQVEVVSGGIVETGNLVGNDNILGGPQGMIGLNQDLASFWVDRVVGGVVGAIGGGMAAIMVHSGGSNEGAPLSVILVGATGGLIQGVVSPISSVRGALTTAASYVAGGAAGNAIMDSAN